MQEVFSMSYEDCKKLLEVAWGHLRGHEFEIADKLFRRAWFARINDEVEEKDMSRVLEIRNKSLEGLAMISEYKSGMVPDKHRITMDKDDARTPEKSTIQLAHALRASSLRAASESLSELVDRRIKSRLIQELNRDPLFCDSLLRKIFQTENVEWNCSESSSDNLTDFDNESDTPPEQILPPCTATLEDEGHLSGERLDRMRDSLHGFVRQVSMETRWASKRRKVPEEMIRNSLGSRLLGLQYSHELPDELKWLVVLDIMVDIIPINYF